MPDLESLAAHFAACQEPTYRLGDGVLVSRFGGRVIGLSAGSSANAVWTHDGLSSADGTGRLVASHHWPNPGGDRVWISPERETHLVNPDDGLDGLDVPATDSSDTWLFRGPAPAIDSIG